MSSAASEPTDTTSCQGGRGMSSDSATGHTHKPSRCIAAYRIGIVFNFGIDNDTFERVLYGKDEEPRGRPPP